MENSNFNLEVEVAIASISFLSFREKVLLRKNIDSLEKLAILSIQELSKIVARSFRAKWDGRQVVGLAKKAVSIMEAKGIKTAMFDSAEFPALLSTIDDPPYILFYRGNIGVFEKPCISVVGTRRICQTGAQAAFDFARTASLCGQTVVSGLAYGIDTWAHKGALASEVKGCTAAILPCGIETVVPLGNKKLAQSILNCGGCIAGEYIPGIPAEAWRFVHRNRLIAALSPAIVVVQAPPDSGALITANFALDYNRDVIFHEAAFCEEAIKIKNKKSISKNCAQSFVQDGAPVIKNYIDYVALRNSPPGMHGRKEQP